MKPGSLFWGTLLLASGILLLLARLGGLSAGLFLPWEWWPVFLILLGMARFTRQPGLKNTLVILAAVLISLLLAGRPHAVVEKLLDGEPPTTETFAEPFGEAITSANLHLDVTAGKLRIRDGSGDLFRAETESNIARFGYHSDRHEDTVSLGFSQQLTRLAVGPELRNDVSVRLHRTPVWDIDLDAGAADLDADVAGLKVKKLTVRSEGPSVVLQFGKLFPDVAVLIRAGVTGITVRIPESAGCDIESETILSDAEIPGFQETAPGHYSTGNHDTASTIFRVRLEAGASSFRVERY